MRSPSIVVLLALLGLALLFMPMAAVPYVPLPFTSGLMPTFSMYPNIVRGDVLYVDRTVGFSEIMVGDIALFWGAADHPISHRVVAHDGTEATTRGDFNDRNDDLPVTADEYLGKVSVVIPVHSLGPQLGYVAGFLLTFSAIMLVSAAAYVLAHREWLRSQFGGARRRRAL